MDGLLDRGALEILDVAAAYRRTGALSPEDQWAFYDAATRRAIAEWIRHLPPSVRPSLRAASRLFGRMWSLLGFDRVTRVEIW